MSSLEQSYQLYRSLLCMPPDTKQELINRIGVIADAYVGSANKDILNQYKDSLQVLLSGNVVNYIKYLNSTGELNRLMSSDPKVAELFNVNSNYSLRNLTKDLKSSGWNLPAESSLDDLTEAISTWGIETVTGDVGSGAEDIENNRLDDLDNINFDSLFQDNETDEELKRQEEIARLRQEEEAREAAEQEAERIKQEAAQEAERIRQEEAARKEAERLRQEEEARKQQETEGIDPESLSDETKHTMELLNKLEHQIPEIPVPEYEDVPPENPNATAEEKANRKAILERNAKLQSEYSDAVADRRARIDSSIASQLQTEREEEERRLALEVQKEMQLDSAMKKEVEKTAKEIMNVYDAMYQPLFASTPLGVLSDKGIIAPTKRDVNGVIKVISAGDRLEQMERAKFFNQLNALYGNVIRTADYTSEISVKDCFNGDELVYNCMPRWHALNMNGIYTGKDGTTKQEKNWKRFRPILLRSLLKAIADIYKDRSDRAKKIQEKQTPGNEAEIEQAGLMAVLGARSKIRELFTTVIILEQFDDKAVMMMAAAPYCPGVNFSDLSVRLNKGLDPSDWPRGVIEIKNTTPLEFGVFSQVIIRNVKEYEGEILFAYKAMEKILDGGGSIGLSNTLIGRDVISNRNVTYNFASPQAISNLIIAGSGSGKGVLTLNILATAIAEGCPTVYLDWKPDMAAMLWELERSVPGSRILAIDGLAGREKDTGSTPVRNYGTGYNQPSFLKKDTAKSEGAAEIYNKLNVIPYVKALQLMVTCAFARSSGFAGLDGNGKKMIFIMDEAQQMNMALDSLRTAISAFIDNKANKPGKGEEASDAYKYVTRLKKTIDIYNGVSDVLRTTGRTGYVGMIILGQAADAASWAKGSLKRDALGTLVGNCSMKMLGKGAINDTKYELNGARDRLPIKDKMGYYAIVDGSVAPRNGSGVKVAKTYLTLNYNDYQLDGVEGPCVSKLLKNITDETLKSNIKNYDLCNIDEETGERSINDRVGFKGLIQYIGQSLGNFDLATNLSNGYNEVAKVLKELGILDMYSDPMNGTEGDIEAYLFDCSLDSLFTIDEMRAALVEHRPVASANYEPEESDEEGSTGDNTIGTYEQEETDGNQGDRNTPPPQTPPPIQTQNRSVDAETLRRLNNIMNNVPHQKIDQPTPPPGGTQQDQQQQGQPVQQGQSQGQQQGQPQDPGAGGKPISQIYYPDSDDSTDPFADLDGSDQPFDINQHQAEPGEMRPNPHKTFEVGGTNKRCIYATPESTSDVVGLTRNNSVLVTMPPYTTAERFHSRLFKTVWGTQYEFKNRWNLILCAAAANQKPQTVSRLIILEDQVIFNKKAIAAVGVLGGDEDIRVEDIVNFKMTAKKYKNIRDLIIDTTILESAQIELGDPFTELFKLFPALMRVSVMNAGSGSVQAVITRAEYQAGRESNEIKDARERAAFKNQFEAIAAARNPNLKNKSPGYQNKAWQTTMQLSGSSWGAAKNALKDNNPSYLRATKFTLGALGILTFGGVASLFGRVGSMFRRR